jgi:hypothetical protein
MTNSDAPVAHAPTGSESAGDADASPRALADAITADHSGPYWNADHPPESPDDYDFAVELDPGETYDVEMDGIAREWFHKAGVPSIEAKALVQTYRDANRMSDAEIDRMGQQTGDFLSRVWGASYDDNLNAARDVARSLGTEFTQLLDDTGLGNDRAVIQTLFRISQQRK